jgi:hypothetical protein
MYLPTSVDRSSSVSNVDEGETPLLPRPVRRRSGLPQPSTGVTLARRQHGRQGGSDDGEAGVRETRRPLPGGGRDAVEADPEKTED